MIGSRNRLAPCASVVLFLLLAFATPQYSAASHRRTFQYQNPIRSVLVRDSQITKVGDTWYMTGTSYPFSEGTPLGPIPGVKIWSSKNLTQWKLVGLVIRPSRKHWYKQRFWAPELFPYDGKWYLTFNCPFGDKPDSPQSVGLAVADKITGPYRVLTVDKPLTDGNDATLFQDDDGKVYLFRAGISAIQVDLKNTRTIGASFRIIQPGVGAVWDGTAPGGPAVSIEGPTVLKHGNIYYLLYASWGRGYEEGYATARRITGPWTKYARNPIYGAQDKKWSMLYKHSYTQSPDIPYTQVGHGSSFIGPDGRVWFGCHGYLKGAGQQPHLIITPITFDRQGVIHMALTWTPQAIVLLRHFGLRMDDTRLASPILGKLAEGR